MIRVRLSSSDPVAVQLRRIAAQLTNPVALYKDTGRRLAVELRTHFGVLERTQPNRLGGRRTGFWSDVRGATSNPEVSPQAATVTIAHLAFAQKLYGGTITAKRARVLTIPVHPLAHGRRASVFEQETGAKLFRPKRKNGTAANVLLAVLDGQPDPVAIYRLARSVTQKPEPRALPKRGQLEAAIADTARKHLRRMLSRGAAGA